MLLSLFTQFVSKDSQQVEQHLQETSESQSETKKAKCSGFASQTGSNDPVSSLLWTKNETAIAKRRAKCKHVR